jgi:ribosomal protein S18 acetylase RimI-like enzyme
MKNPLENLVWNALTTAHAHFAVGAEGVRRYPRDMVPFAGMEDASHRDISALEPLIAGDGDLVYLIGAEPRGTEKLQVGEPVACYQMLFAADGRVAEDAESELEILRLGAADAAEMVELTKIVGLGFMGMRQYLMGDFFGIRDGGKLAAMAGERMALPELREVSAVCTHPEYLGRGYAGLLTRLVMRGLIAGGKRPFLHVKVSNERARGLYERLGFEIQQSVLVWPVTRVK